MKYVEVKTTKCIMYLEEADLWKYLPSDILAEALKRGKAFKRVKQYEAREQNKTNRSGQNEF